MANKVQAILARDISNLGHVGDVVKVAAGYLRNFLLPKRLALPVSKTRIEHFEHQRKLIEHQLAKLKKTSEDVRDRIESESFTIEMKAGEQGKLFGSAGARDIEAVLKARGYNVAHRDIKLADGPLKTIGLHELPVRLEGGVMAKIKVFIAKIEEAPEPVAAETEGEDFADEAEQIEE